MNCLCCVPILDSCRVGRGGPGNYGRRCAVHCVAKNIFSRGTVDAGATALARRPLEDERSDDGDGRTLTIIGFQGLMMEPEGKHRNSIMKQRILAVFGLVEIVLRCILTMNDFQDLMMQLEGV
ncbi:hypothetical protein EVAR_87436_1 [Eumeta japonica]|uniref:Uncharacterized protein n=1 Tax=Eumeta variegata TaxID=151549 RepID=A0A4C1XKL7_EUMVA|nr:hypothetical protein EVAR_87436_1 [Eumeta japonica]